MNIDSELLKEVLKGCIIIIKKHKNTDAGDEKYDEGFLHALEAQIMIIEDLEHET